MMALAQQLKQKRCDEDMQQGIRKGLLKEIELALEFEFGEQGRLLLLAIQNIQDLTHLEAIKEVIKTSDDISGVQTAIESNLTSS